MKAKYQHDCTRCIFVGTLFNSVDVYVHENPDGDSLIGRFSSDGPDYTSTCDFRNAEYSGLMARIGGLSWGDAKLLALTRLLPSTLLNGMVWNNREGGR